MSLDRTHEPRLPTSETWWAMDEEDPVGSGRATCTKDRDAQAELKSSLKTTLIHGHLRGFLAANDHCFFLPWVEGGVVLWQQASAGAPNSPACSCTGLMARVSWGDVSQHEAIPSPFRPKLPLPAPQHEEMRRCHPSDPLQWRHHLGLRLFRRRSPNRSSWSSCLHVPETV